MIEIIDALCDRVFEIVLFVICISFAISVFLGAVLEATGSCKQETQNVTKDSK